MTQRLVDEGDQFMCDSCSSTSRNSPDTIEIVCESENATLNFSSNDLQSMLQNTLRNPIKYGLYNISQLDANTSQWRWHITQWRTRTSAKIWSDSFTVGEKSFKIDVRPNGFKNDGYVSVFLEQNQISENHELHYRVSVINQKNPIRSAHSKVFKQNFSSKDPGWGVIQLLAINDLYDGFLVNDTLIVEVSVAIGNKLTERQQQYLRLYDVQGVVDQIATLNNQTSKWRWQVPHWSRNMIINSESIFFAGEEWRLEVVPKRHYSEDHLGVFLRKIGSTKAQVVHFQITLLNNRREMTHYESGYFSPVFDVDHLCWGFRKYIASDKLCYGYIAHDTLTFELSISVAKTLTSEARQFFKVMECLPADA